MFVLDILLFSSLLRSDVMTTAGRLAIVCYSAVGVGLLLFRRLAPVAIFGVIWLHSVVALVVTDRYVPVVFLLVALEAVAELRSAAPLAGRPWPPFSSRPRCWSVQAVARRLGAGRADGRCRIGPVLHRPRRAGLGDRSVGAPPPPSGRPPPGRNTPWRCRNSKRETEHAVSAERLRIARELHDIVAHSVTIMVLHAAGAKRVVDTDPARAKESLTTIEESGQQAMGELRRLLELLREDGSDDVGSGSPLPGLAQLATTIQSVRGSGVAVTLDVSGTPRRLDASTDLAAYRLIQEAPDERHQTPRRRARTRPCRSNGARRS